MKAMVYEQYGGPEVQKWVDVPEPKAGPNDVVLKVHAAGLNYNDIHSRRGYPVQNPLPHISGSDVSGVVVEVGSEVRDVKVGDEVMVHCSLSCRQCAACTRGEEFFCRSWKIWGFQTGPLDGAYAEYARVPAAAIIPKPQNLTHVEAASLPLIAQTVWRQLVKRGGLRPGDLVVIWGAAGGLGSMAIQVTKLFNATAIAIANSDEKLAFCKELGADYLINRKTQDVFAEVRRITRPNGGADIVFEHPGAATIDASLRMARWGGNVVTSGATSGHDAQIDLRHIFFRQVSLIGSTMGTKNDLIEILEHFESGALRPMVSQTWHMSELNAAQAVMEQDEAKGKLVVTL